MINKTKPRGLPDYEGKHEGPMRYVVRLAQPEHAEAWLLDKFSDGDPEMRLLCHVRGDGTAALRDCVEALWHDGAHPGSVLELWWGEDPHPRTPDRVMTSTICAAVPGAYAAAMTVQAMRPPA